MPTVERAPAPERRSISTTAVRIMQRLAAMGPVVRHGVPYLVDVACWGIALFAAAMLRFDFQLSSLSITSVLLVWLVVAVLQLVGGLIANLYRGRHRYASFDEMLALGWTVIIVALIAGVAVIAFGAAIGLMLPRSAVFLAAPLALVGMVAARWIKRRLVELHLRPTETDTVRTLIYGAGEVGSVLVRRMLSDPNSRYFPVGFIDDEPRKRNLAVQGIRVLGTGADVRAVAEAVAADEVIVAIGRADAATLRRIQDSVVGSGLKVKVLPPLEQMLTSEVSLGGLRDLRIDDLIGRAPVETDVSAIADYVNGARVLVTGAGGSIGSELAVQLSKFGPAKLVLVDRDESGLQSTQITIHGNGLLSTDDVVLVDIRDQDALAAVFEHARPQVVFHAAALKHLPLLEQYPDEAWKTNVLGTLNVLRASMAVGVGTFVNISTDKAANPTSVLGHSKRVAEKLTAWAARETRGTGARYVSVRFGNVIGSRGSMLPTFTRLIEAGGPVTVTHPEVTRYFMTIPEACQLVIQAGAIGRPGEVLILDMGEPVSIREIAERMIRMSGKDVQIVYTGLRPGEKIHEVLVGTDETDGRPFHPLVSHTEIDFITPERLDQRGWRTRMAEDPKFRDTSAITLTTDGAPS